MSSLLPPFDDWPRQRVEPGVGAFWFLAPDTFVFHATCAHGDGRALAIVNDRIDDCVAHLDGRRGLRVLHDWRNVKSFDPKLRKAWVARIEARPADYLAASYLVVPHNPLLRMAVSAVNLAMAMRKNTGALHLETTIDAAFEGLGHPVPAPSDRWPGARRA